MVRRRIIRAIIMPPLMERMHWMPSPPLAPDDGPLDRAHLARQTLGDASLEREVLAMFAAQSTSLMDALAPLAADAGDVAHTLKGSALAIGAFWVADAAEWLELTLKREQDAGEALMALSDAVAETRSAIDGILRRS
jgi:HPt (histidine-containing phosphotransfer) domain-containing protein